MKQSRSRLPAAVLVAALAFCAATSARAADDTPVRIESSACAPLQGLAIPASAIGLPTSGAVVSAAVAVNASDAGNINGGFCKVTGIVKPKNAMSSGLEFEVNLPFSWNRRVLQMGGGGYDGSLVTGLTPFTLQAPNTDTPLLQGYVTLGSDGGHKGKPGFDGSFGKDDEALLNYGKQSVKKAHDAAMAVIKKAYRPRAGAVLLHRRLAGRTRGARRGRALSPGLRRRRRQLSGL